jgi:hypothetical protein
VKLVLLDGEFAVARLPGDEATPAWATEGGLSSVTRTAEELSVVCAASAVPAAVLICAVGALVVGGLVFVPRIAGLLGHSP